MYEERGDVVRVEKGNSSDAEYPNYYIFTKCFQLIRSIRKVYEPSRFFNDAVAALLTARTVNCALGIL